LESYNIESHLPNLKLPILTFVGDKDISYYPAVVEYSRLIPNCTTFVLPCLDHPETLSVTNQVFPHVLKFLNQFSRI